MVKPAARRRAVGFLQSEMGLSERRACRALGFLRSSHRYVAKRDDRASLRLDLRRLAAARPRYGYRRLHVLLGREGIQANHKLVHRLYREEGLALRRKERRKRVAQERVPRPKVEAPNESWSMDFVSDMLVDGRRLRVLAVVDNCTREALVLEVDFSMSGEYVARNLDRVIGERGPPARIVCDNGPEFASRALDLWAYERGVKLAFIRPGKPVENAFVESFNGSFRDECLNQNLFLDIVDARQKVEAWRDDYNSFRPHSSLADQTPREYAQQFNTSFSRN
jgi:putative transposase